MRWRAASGQDVGTGLFMVNILTIRHARNESIKAFCNAWNLRTLDKSPPSTKYHLQIGTKAFLGRDNLKFLFRFSVPFNCAVDFRARGAFHAVVYTFIPPTPYYMGTFLLINYLMYNIRFFLSCLRKVTVIPIYLRQSVTFEVKLSLYGHLKIMPGYHIT